jgi:fructokinase
VTSYDVYGIGNALVDLEFSVTTDELGRLQVAKGLMTLIDESRHLDLLERLDPGQLQGRGSGGSAANTMIAVAQLGGASFYSCKVAADEMGDFYRQDLLEAGVASNVRPEGDGDHTGKCIVLVSEDAERSMCTHLGITARLSKAEVDEAAITRASWVYLEGYLAASPTATEAACRVREIAEAHGVRTSLTLSDCSMTEFCRDGLKAMLGSGVDLVFSNEAEALQLTGTADLDAAARAMSQVARSFVITLGARGALVHDGDRSVTVPSPTIRAIDTNGAGDMFAGSFLYGITHGMDFPTAARLANRASGRLIQEYGARLPAAALREVQEAFLADG